MRIRTTAVLATSLAVLPLTACSSSPDGKPAAGPAVTAPSSSAPPSASPSPSRAAPLTFGQSLTTSTAEDGSVATATVIGYQQGVKAQQSADKENGTDGYVWAALELKERFLA
ncbi:hypothetical protein ACFCYH_35275 [Streptomyces sp. NPDC056400]|uniref:hypothetical protein n=1 Tax=Streptomyces sp. NPDC056400 TaxID=3345808 RepID=UPI0035E043BC